MIRRHLIFASLTLLGALALGACTLSSTNQPATSTAPTTNTQTPSQPTPVPAVKIQSSGDVQTDLNTVNKELNGLNANADFPSFTQQDLEK